MTCSVWCPCELLWGIDNCFLVNYNRVTRAPGALGSSHPDDSQRPGTHSIVRHSRRPDLLVAWPFMRGRQDQAPRTILLQAPPLAVFSVSISDHVRGRSCSNHRLRHREDRARLSARQCSAVGRRVYLFARRRRHIKEILYAVRCCTVNQDNDVAPSLTREEG